MFLPTKPHEKEIVKNQPRLRLGNRIPKDAVNLAYVQLPSLHSKENVQIRDLSNTILSNSRNSDPDDILMIPDSDLCLKSLDGKREIKTEAALITNIFHEDTPLYYAHTLQHFHYDHKGPDRYGLYHGDGINIVDENGKEIIRPYIVQLIPSTEYYEMYKVIIYTSFKDHESDTYRVIYNANIVYDDGRIDREAGHEERLTLKPAFSKSTLSEVVDRAENQTIDPIYYQGNTSTYGSHSFYSPTKEIIDNRHREYFRYQLILEVILEGETKENKIYMTPWRSETVMNSLDIVKEEKELYVNGDKQLIHQTAYELMSEYVDLSTHQGEGVILNFTVRTDNPYVKVTTRIDGSSAIFAHTSKQSVSQLQVPMKSHYEQTPVTKSGDLYFRFRPIRARKDHKQNISFVIDTSASMNRNDPDRIIRHQYMKDVVFSAQEFYDHYEFSGYAFNSKMYRFQKDFVEDFHTLEQEFFKLESDRGLTDPTSSLLKALDSLRGTIGDKTIAIVTDGRIENLDVFQTIMKEAALSKINVCIVTFYNIDELREIVSPYKLFKVIDARSEDVSTELKYFFYGLGIKEAVGGGSLKGWTVNPSENDKRIHTVDSKHFVIPHQVKEEKDRYVLEVILDAPKAISLHIQTRESKKKSLSYNDTHIIPVSDLLRKEDNVFDIYVSSVLYEAKFHYIYALRMLDQKRIKVLPPRETEADKSWFVRVQNGRFDEHKTNYNNVAYDSIYSVAEYYRQPFIQERGMPYIAVYHERPKILNEYQLQVGRTPLFIEYSKNQATNASVWVNGKRAKIKKSSSFNGIIDLEYPISSNDDIYVDYEYEEDSYTYRGYWDEESNRFLSLDLNPSVGHYTTIKNKENGEIQNIPSFTLINKVVYLYLKPTYMKYNTGETAFNTYTLFHSFEKVEENEAILIAEIRVRPNSNLRNLQVIDTRVRGGGLKPEITHSMMKEYEKESFYYWDIGFWDGQPYPENAVVSFRIKRTILKEYGGKFSKDEVEKKIDKYLAFGVLPIIEYIDDSDYLLQMPQNLVIDVVEVADDGDNSIERPTFTLALEEINNATS